MFLKLLLAFTIIPLVELMLLIKISQATSLMTTIAIVVATGIAGSFLAKQQGASVWWKFQQALAEGRVPAPELQDGLLIFMAAGLLLTPGLMTDAFGFALLIPQTRVFFRSYLAKKLRGKIKVQTAGFGQHNSNDPNTIDADGARTVEDETH